MKKNILVISSLTSAIAVFFLIVSCYKLDPRDNKFDPGGTAFSGTNGSNAMASGWKIDASGGAGGSPCLRCINVPMGEARRISFSLGSYSGGVPTFASMEGTNLIKAFSIGSGLSYKITISNHNGGGNEKVSWTKALGSDVANFTPFFSAISLDPNTFTGASSSCTYYITVSNSSDSDGTNVIYFDDLKFGYTAGTFTPGVFDFSSLSDSSLTGDKQQ